MTIEERDYLFDQALALSGILEQECLELLGMMENIDDRVAISRAISKLESEGDDIFHATGARLQKMELDPETRIKIFQMIRHVEDVTDMVDELSKTIVRYNTRTVTNGFKASVNSINGAVKKLVVLINAMREYTPEMKDHFTKTVNTFDAFKVDYEKMYDVLIFDLFSKPHDVVDIIRCKAIYDAIRDIFEAFEVSADDAYKYIVSKD
ncbi:MAG: DUF47 family protein [Clostridiales bacterium]|nr:DUF47 family protein [Clostridiales bacterium]MBR6488081.1 DUF47 family protein [Clostridiales bacterium]